MTDASTVSGPAPVAPATPSAPPGVLKRWFGDVNPLRVIGGTFLALLVVVAAASAVIFFAAAQFQSRIAELSLNGVPLTIWRVDNFRSEFKVWREDLTALRKDTAKARQEHEATQGRIIELQTEQTVLEERLAEDAKSLYRKVSAAVAELTAVAAPQSKDTANQATPATNVAPSFMTVISPTISDTLTEIDLLLNNDTLTKRFGENFTRLRTRYAEIQGSKAKLQSNTSQGAISLSRIKSLEDQLKDRADTAAKLFGATSNNVAPEIVERIVNISSELASLADVWNGLIYSTALWTNDMLVLLLLISMGVLGSALNLLAVFFTNEKDSLSFGEYPLRLAFGAVLAIVMFIIAKAGVPILADTTKIGGNAPLNPYFISLLAIVSGLMSDRAMGTIRNVATTLLQSVGGADFSQRYARVALDNALTTANRKVEGLAQLLGMSIDETKKLFSGNDLVAPDRQKLISAYLNQPPRELFSDLPAG